MSDDEASQPRAFDIARGQIEAAKKAEVELAEFWNALCSIEPFTSRVVALGSSSARLEVHLEWPPELRRSMEESAARFTEAVVAALDGAVRAAVSIAGGKPLATLSNIHMPLCADETGFIAEAMKPALKHLRPDQLDLLGVFQPFGDVPSDAGVSELVRQAMTHLDALRRRRAAEQPLVAVWAHVAEPQFEDTDGSHVSVDCVIAEPGVLDPTRSIAEFTCTDRPLSSIATNPNVEFSPVFHAPPYPDDPDDTMGTRAAGIITIAAEFIDAMERSSQRDALLPGYEWMAQQLARREGSPWGKVDLKRSPIGKDLRRALRRSDLGVATLVDENGNATMFVQAEGSTYARPVPRARHLPEDMHTGLGAEHASLLAAGEWGLRDFVMRPQLVRKGEGSREVGDGTVIVGNRALAIQVKARAEVSESPDREERWVTKQIRTGGSQASGTIRLLRSRAVTLVNQRGRDIAVDGSSLEWLRVVIIDHPNAPRVQLARDPEATDPVVVLLRRDWEFLLDQLRSLTGVVDYLFRVASEDTYTLGNEPARYFEFARYDADASVRAPADRATPIVSPTQFSSPTLPITPASRMDTIGHLVYRTILEDIAESTSAHSENDRLHLLSLLDRYPIADRALLGKVLLERLRDVMVESPDIKWQFRRVALDNGRLQLAFGATARLDERIQEAFRQWAMLRHHEFTSIQPADTRDAQRTVAVLLTPRYDGLRYWDTTMFAALGDLELEPDEVAQFRQLWDRQSAA